jgi:hypothetical protein
MILNQRPYRHPPGPPPSLCTLIMLLPERLKRHVQSDCQGLTSPIPHFEQISSLCIFIYAEDQQRKKAFEFHRRPWMQGLPVDPGPIVR